MITVRFVIVFSSFRKLSSQLTILLYSNVKLNKFSNAFRFSQTLMNPVGFPLQRNRPPKNVREEIISYFIFGMDIKRCFQLCEELERKNLN